MGQELAEMIKSKPASELKEFAVVDVRDSDFVVSCHWSNVCGMG